MNVKSQSELDIGTCSFITFSRIADIVAAAINGSVLLCWVTVLVATLGVEGGKIGADIPETVSVGDDFLFD